MAERNRRQAAINVLTRAGLVGIDVGRLSRITDKELMGYRGCGQKTLSEIKQIIKLLNIKNKKL